MKKFFILFICVLVLFVAKAQYFQTGQDPASIKWRQINSENFQLIYPDYFEDQAQKLASTFEKVYNYGSYSLNHKPEKISIVLHTQTVKSNGLVAYAPKRSELYTTPHQGIYAQDWLEQLAIHEFRHVVQLDKINAEIPKIIKMLLGEQGTALLFGAYLPWWFIEGDAVVLETTLSNFGRGRFPSFLMEHKAQVVEKGRFSYDKAYNGSFKDFVPDHYKLGYYIVANANERYGAGLWDSVTTRVGKRPFSFNPFNKALKAEIGLSKVQLYSTVFDSLKNVWEQEDKLYIDNLSKSILPETNVFSNYTHNHFLNDSTIISYKTAFNEIPSFVKINSKNKESKIISPGTIFKESVNYRGEWIVWSEQIPDLRWSHSGRSLIRLHNVENNKKNKFYTEFKALAPSLSPDKKSIVVVETDFSNNSFLSVYSVHNGSLLTRIQTKNNNYFFSPDWVNDKEIISIVLFNKGKRLVRFNINTGDFKLLTDIDLGELKNLKIMNNYLYFISSYSGKDALYCLNLNSNIITQVYSPRFGAAYPAISKSENKIVLSDYTANGFRLIEVPVKSEIQPIIEKTKKEIFPLAKKLAKQERGVIDFSDHDTASYTSTKYLKSRNLMNFHSWAPATVNVYNYEIRPGFSLMSQNILGTAETILGYRWDMSEKAGQVYANYIFKGWYPLFNAEVSYGKRGADFRQITQTQNNKGEIVHQDTTTQRSTWNQAKADLGIRLPLDFSKGAFNRFLQPEIQYDFTLYKHDDTTPEEYFEGDFQSLTYRLYYHQLLKQSYQDVFPNLGLIVDGSYRHSPIGSEYFGNLIAGQTVLYLPGFLKNHGVKIYGGAQMKENGSNLSFSDVVRYPRGWARISTTEIYSGALDYKLPVFYPDLSFAGLAYFRRITASVFADYSYLKGDIYTKGKKTGRFKSNISSFGMELQADANFLRFYAPANIGFRASYLPQMKNVYFDFLFSIDFTSF